MAVVEQSRERRRTGPSRSRHSQRQIEGRRTWGVLVVGASRRSEEIVVRIQECWELIESEVERGRGQIERGHAEPWTS